MDREDIDVEMARVHDAPSAGRRTTHWRRDWWLLPGIFLLTWLFIGLVGEVTARVLFPDQELDACHVNDSIGNRFKANCHSRIKMVESQWVDNDYNDCGYRSAYSCKASIPNALRVAVLGTSISRGYWVSYNQGFAGRIEHDLAVACARPVDVQNVAQSDSIEVTDNGMIPLWHHVADHVPEALRLHPDALVLVMSPFDLASYASMPGEKAPAATTPRPSFREKLSRMVKTVKDKVANESTVMVLARHLAFRDNDRYVLHELEQGDSSAYLKQPFSANWLLRLKVADATIGRVASQAKAADVPLIVVLMPLRPQAALSVNGVDRHGTHPFALGRAMGSIVRAHGARFIDMTRVVSTLQDPADLFFELNGHPNAAGHAVLAASVERALVSDVPSFASCKPGPGKANSAANGHADR